MDGEVGGIVAAAEAHAVAAGLERHEALENRAVGGPQLGGAGGEVGGGDGGAGARRDDESLDEGQGVVEGCAVMKIEDMEHHRAASGSREMAYCSENI